jgi:hypothetical protein
VRWHSKDEWDANGTIINVVSVVFLLVFPEAFPMVRGEHDQTVVIKPPLLQPFEEPAQFGIYEFDFSIIGLLPITRSERFWRLIGIVRII